MFRRRVVNARVLGLGICLLLTAGAGGVLAQTTASTPTGENHTYDVADQIWTFTGSLHYQSWDTSGNTEIYDWGYTDGATVNPSADEHYVDAPVYYRAAIIYDGSTLLWESSAQDQMPSKVLDGTSADQCLFSPTDNTPWEGSLTNQVIYKVQTAPAQNTHVEAVQVGLAHNQ